MDTYGVRAKNMKQVTQSFCQCPSSVSSIKECKLIDIHDTFNLKPHINNNNDNVLIASAYLSMSHRRNRLGGRVLCTVVAGGQQSQSTTLEVAQVGLAVRRAQSS